MKMITKSDFDIVYDSIVLGLWEQAEILSAEFGTALDIEREDDGSTNVNWINFKGNITGYTILC